VPFGTQFIKNLFFQKNLNKISGVIGVLSRDRKKLGIWAASGPDPAKSWPSLAQAKKSGPGENSGPGKNSCSAEKLIKTKIMTGRKIN
jgi:hypothetical protein